MIISGAQQVHSQFPRCRARKSKPTWKNRRSPKRHRSVYVCLDGPFPWPASAKLASIHPYTTFNNSLFYVFGMFLSKNVCLVEEIEFRGFGKKTLIFRVCMLISSACMVIKTKTFSFEVSKNQIGKTKVFMDGCMDVWMHGCMDGCMDV